jgi:tetratricopeptide (TPR) repeat protein
MKKVLGSLALFGILATGSMTYAGNLDVSPEENFEKFSQECWKAFYNGDQETNIECDKKLLELYEKQGRYDDVMGQKLELAVRYMNLKDYENAEKYYLELLEDAKKRGNKGMEAGAYNGLGGIYEEKGDIYKEKGDKDKAKEYYMKAKEYYVKAYKVFKAEREETEREIAKFVLDSIKRVNKKLKKIK